MTSVYARPCWICQSEPAIQGDGPKTPCRDCLGRMMFAVNHPEELSRAEIELLRMAHGDVVVMLELDEGPIWRWFGAGF